MRRATARPVRVRRIALGSWLVIVAFVLLDVALLILTRATAVPDSWGFRGATGLAAMVFGSVGAIVALRRPENPIGWLQIAIGLFFSVESAVIEYTVLGLVAAPGSVPLARELGWMLSWIWIPPVGLALVYLPLLFPTGRLPSPRWGRLAWLGGPAIVIASLGLSIAPGPIQQARYLVNPLAVPGVDPQLSTSLGGLADALLGVAIVLAVGSLVRRFRMSSGEVRQQLKWFAFAAAIAVAGFAGNLVLYLVSPNPGIVKAGEVVLFFSILGMPVAAGIAILRYRLYDIDRIISRTVSYAVVSGILAAVLGVAIVALQGVLAPVTQGQTLAVAGSTLLVAALFQPIRRRIQAIVDRRFNRARIDAERTVEAFAARLRDVMDLDTVRTDLASVTQDALHPEHVGIWIRVTGDAPR